QRKGRVHALALAQRIDEESALAPRDEQAETALDAHHRRTRPGRRLDIAHHRVDVPRQRSIRDEPPSDTSGAHACKFRIDLRVDDPFAVGSGSLVVDAVRALLCSHAASCVDSRTMRSARMPTLDALACCSLLIDAICAISLLWPGLHSIGPPREAHGDIVRTWSSLLSTWASPLISSTTGQHGSCRAATTTRWSPKSATPHSCCSSTKPSTPRGSGPKTTRDRSTAPP